MISPDKVKAKLEILADAAKYDASCSSSGSRRAGELAEDLAKAKKFVQSGAKFETPSL